MSLVRGYSPFISHHPSTFEMESLPTIPKVASAVRFRAISSRIRENTPALIPPGGRSYSLYAYSLSHQQKRATVSRIYPGPDPTSGPVTTAELVADVNTVIRGWVACYKKAHVRKLFHQLDHWSARRLWSHRYQRSATLDGNGFLSSAFEKNTDWSP